jgi:hypothetical protein
MSRYFTFHTGHFPKKTAAPLENVMKKAIVIGTLALVVVTAHATDWRLVKRLPDATFFIDTASVRIEGDGSNEGDVRKINVLLSYKEIQKAVNGTQFLSMSFVDVISCANRTITTLSSTQYEGENGTGKKYGFHKMNIRIPVKIEPGTVNEYLMEMYVCDLK